MCDPVTAMVVMGASAGMSAIGAMQQAEAANRQADYNSAIARNNAAMAETQAQDAQRRGEEEAIAVQRKAAQVRGAQRATMAARGLDLGTGTSAALVDQTDYFGAVDTGTARDNAGREAWAKRQQASNFSNEASMFQAGKQDVNMVGMTSLLGSASSFVSSKWAPSGGGGKTPSSASWGREERW